MLSFNGNITFIGKITNINAQEFFEIHSILY